VAPVSCLYERPEKWGQAQHRAEPVPIFSGRSKVLARTGPARTVFFLLLPSEQERFGNLGKQCAAPLACNTLNEDYNSGRHGRPCVVDQHLANIPQTLPRECASPAAIRNAAALLALFVPFLSFVLK
jgi:hypothetical protein